MNKPQLQIGFIFTGKFFTGKVEVLKVDRTNNKLEVKLFSNFETENYWFETWDLEHTELGFFQLIYFEKTL